MRVTEDLLGMDLGFVEKDLAMIQRYFENFLEIFYRPFLIQFVIFPIQNIHNSETKLAITECAKKDILHP